MPALRTHVRVYEQTRAPCYLYCRTLSSSMALSMALAAVKRSRAWRAAPAARCFRAQPVQAGPGAFAYLFDDDALESRASAYDQPLPQPEADTAAAPVAAITPTSHYTAPEASPAQECSANRAQLEFIPSATKPASESFHTTGGRAKSVPPAATKSQQLPERIAGTAAATAADTADQEQPSDTAQPEPDQPEQSEPPAIQPLELTADAIAEVLAEPLAAAKSTIDAPPDRRSEQVFTANPDVIHAWLLHHVFSAGVCMLGLDAEWPASRQHSSDKVAVLQIATSTSVLVVPLQHVPTQAARAPTTQQELASAALAHACTAAAASWLAEGVAPLELSAVLRRPLNSALFASDMVARGRVAARALPLPALDTPASLPGSPSSPSRLTPGLHALFLASSEAHAGTPVTCFAAVKDHCELSTNVHTSRLRGPVMVGAAVAQDAALLHRQLRMPLATCLDTGAAADEAALEHAPRGLATQARLLLGAPAWKSKRVTCSNWAAPELTEQQVLYAARDAWYSRAVADACVRAAFARKRLGQPDAATADAWKYLDTTTIPAPSTSAHVSWSWARSWRALDSARG